MFWFKHRRLFSLFGLGFFLWFLFFVGCQSRKGYLVKTEFFPPYVKKLVVVGFQPAILADEEAGVRRSPISGAVFMAEPVPQHIAKQMNDHLLNNYLRGKGYDMILPSQAKGVFSSLVSSGSVASDIEIFKKIGRIFSADAVLAGYIYRWRERKGTDYAADRPASVAFDLYLIRSTDGAIIGKGRYDKTQQPLSENLFDMETFKQGGGKWMKAERLADIGMNYILGDLPDIVPDREE
ncbi:hypothetical protein ACFL9T_09875 [Thermodesulfobacteriota bacterium]